MAEKLLALSQNDVQVLKDLIASVRDKGTNTQGRTLVDQQDAGQQTFIAKAPVGGIAAATSLSVTSIDCSIYQRVDGTIVDAGFTRPIYNLSQDLIPAGSIVQVAQDNWGTWWTHSLASGSGTYHFGVTLTAITAGNDSTAGHGTVSVYTLDQAGVYSVTTEVLYVNNLCSAIPAGWWVDIHTDSLSGRHIVTPRCALIAPDIGTGSGTPGLINPVVVVTCDGAYNVSTQLCLTISNQNGTELPGSDVGCATEFGTPLTLNYAGRNGTLYQWSGSSTSGSCGKQFTLYIQDGSCLMTLLGFLTYPSGGEMIGSNGALGVTPGYVLSSPNTNLVFETNDDSVSQAGHYVITSGACPTPAPSSSKTATIVKSTSTGGAPIKNWTVSGITVSTGWTFIVLGCINPTGSFSTITLGGVELTGVDFIFSSHSPDSLLIYKVQLEAGTYDFQMLMASGDCIFQLQVVNIVNIDLTDPVDILAADSNSTVPPATGSAGTSNYASEALFGAFWVRDKVGTEAWSSLTVLDKVSESIDGVIYELSTGAKIVAAPLTVSQTWTGLTSTSAWCAFIIGLH